MNDSNIAREEDASPPMITAEQTLFVDAKEFLLKLDALLETVNRIMIIVVKSRKRALEEFSIFLRPLLSSRGGKTVFFTIGSVQHREFLKLKSAQDKALEAGQIVPQSFLVSMVSQYDAFLASALRSLFLLKPEKIFSSEKSISVKQIIQFTTVEEVLRDQIDSEIDEILRDGHLKQLQWTAKRFDFSIDEKDDLIRQFVEVTERRNLCVHTGGRVSKQYLNRTTRSESEPGKNSRLGDRISISRPYLSQARNTLFETAIRTVQVAWRKIRPDQSEHQDQLLIEVIFELLCRDDFSLARNISDFAATLRGVSGEVSKRTLCINRAQAYKWSGKADEAQRIVSELDWTASDPKFRLAVAIIKDEFDVAARLMESVPDHLQEGISKDSYRSWPLFREARGQEIFANAFLAKFDEPLREQTVAISNSVEVSESILQDQEIVGEEVN